MSGSGISVVNLEANRQLSSNRFYERIVSFMMIISFDYHPDFSGTALYIVSEQLLHHITRYI